MGAGFRGSSSLFQPAGDLLKSSEKTPGDSTCEEEEESGKTQKKKNNNNNTSPIKAKNSSSSSPSKRLSRKQQKLAEAARDTRLISMYFGKKQAQRKSLSEPEETEDVCEETEDACEETEDACADRLASANDVHTLSSSSVDAQRAAQESLCEVTAHAEDYG